MNETRGTEISTRPEREKTPRFDAVVVCGMGPVALKETRIPTNLVARNYMNFLNAVSAKLLGSHGVAERVVLSGRASQEYAGVTNLSELQKMEKQTSEAELLAYTYTRATPKNVTSAERTSADAKVTLEPEAKTTFGNIIQTLNMLDKEADGYWEGSLGIISSEFHGPRIAEMVDAFGLSNAHFLSAERIFKHFGYKGRLYPREKSGYTETDGGSKLRTQFEEDVYKGQPAGLENLKTNPSYVTFELAALTSDKRLQEMAHALKEYYQRNHIDLPDAYTLIPETYDPAYDYGKLRDGLKAVPFSKNPYSGEKDETVGYRELAAIVADKTDELLQGIQ